ncbi:MAG: polysaccharide biosynthesis tyrosine autokinase [Advenella sp.]
MTASQQNTQSTLAQHNDKDDIDFMAILDSILDAKWLIGIITSICLLLAIAYAMFSTPIYQANTLIQVEQNNNNSNAAMGELAALFDSGSSIGAEMEILRSRLVVGETVDRLQLHNSASPDYIPIVGRWLAKRSRELSEPGIFGFGGYVSGTESIRLSQLDVPTELQGQELKVVATEQGYSFLTENNDILAEGVPGQTYTFLVNDKPGRINIAELNGKPGAMFTVVSTSRQGIINSLQSQLNISEKGKQSGMLAVTLEGTDRALITNILNTLGNVFVSQNVQRKAAEAEKSLSFLDAFLPELRKQMQESENQYTQFRDSKSTYDLGAEGKASLDTSVNLQLKLLELQQKRRELLPQFTPAHPSIKAIDQQIAALNKEIEKLTSNVKKLPELEQQLLNLTRNVKVNSEMYVNLLNSAQQLRLVKEGKVGNVRVIDEAVATGAPIKPQKSLILAIGFALGLMLGVAVAVIRATLHPGIKEPNEIESSLGLHVFATIPRSLQQIAQYQQVNDRAPGNHVLAYVAPQDPAIESLRSLRTALQFAMLEANNNIVLISGPTPKIGKSFTSVNFAAVLGAASKKILLIDADLRKGYINQYFGKARKNGVSEFISGTIGLEQAIHKNVLPNVDFMSTGVLPPNPSELLLSAQAIEKLHQLSKYYDLVLVDSAPVLAVSDAMALAPHVGTTFLLARANETTLGELDESSKRIRQAGGQVKGVIFNDMVAKNRRYGYKYGYYRYANYEYGSDA